MKPRMDDLWQGGPWEQPSPVIAPRGAGKQQKKRLGKPVMVFLCSLALIGGLTAGVHLFRDGPPWEVPKEPGAVTLPDGQGKQGAKEQKAGETLLPRAETGTGVTMTVNPVGGERLDYTQVYEKTQNSIVTVHAMDHSGMGEGTGIVMTADGYIITNAHVVEGAIQAFVTTANDVTYDAKLVGMSLEEDLAVLKVEAQNLSPAEFGDSFALRVGEEVSALGNPLGYRMSLSTGVVSALDRELVVEGSTMHLIQTTAAINFGNSGGALFNDRGQVVGVTVVKIVTDDGATEGLGFAIPTERVKYVVDHLIAGEALRVPALGITVQQNAERMGLTVKKIESWSGAVKAGLREGDLLLSANGYRTRTNRDLERIKDLQRVGDILHLEVRRGDEILTVGVPLVDYSDHYAQQP